MYAENNKDMRLCVRTFDEKLCQKASKHYVQGLENHLEDDYMTKQDMESWISNIETGAKEREDRAKEFVNSISEFQKNIHTTFNEICNDIVDEKLDNYDGLCKDFAKFLCP